MPDAPLQVFAETYPPFRIAKLQVMREIAPPIDLLSLRLIEGENPQPPAVISEQKQGL